MLDVDATIQAIPTMDDDALDALANLVEADPELDDDERDELLNEIDDELFDRGPDDEDDEEDDDEIDYTDEEDEGLEIE